MAINTANSILRHLLSVSIKHCLKPLCASSRRNTIYTACTTTTIILSQRVIKQENLIQVKYGHQMNSYSTRVVGTDNLVITEGNGETIIRSPYQDIPDSEVCLREFMFQHLDEYKNLELMVHCPTGQPYTGAQIKDSVIRVASALTKRGYKKGDVILIFSTNCPEYTIICLACAALGVTVTTANPVYVPAELARQLAHSETCAVFTLTAMLPTVRTAIESLEEVSRRIKDIFTMDGIADKCMPYKVLLEDKGSSFPDMDINSSEVTLILPYSSGTTGLPKGVMLTHKNVVMNLLQAKLGPIKLKAGEVTMGLLPFYHIYGMTLLMFGSLTRGSKLIIQPKFEPDTFLKSIQEYQISYLNVVPPTVLFLAKDQRTANFNLSSLQTLVSGAAPLGAGVCTELEYKLNVNILQAYGLTECSPLTHSDEYPPKRGTIGRLIPNTTCKIIDPVSGQTLKPGETGEMLIRGPQVMKGYLKNEEATYKTIKDGWLYTGDIGNIDAEGYFTISDRLKELIKYKGYQVAPAELEALLCTHPAIQDAAVVGLTAEEDVGEVPKAYVVTKPGLHLTTKEIIEFVDKNVSPYKRLRGGVEFLHEIPKTASGKILRRVLRDK